MKFTKVSATTFENLQLNAGILLDSFTPATQTIGNIVGATSGGIKFSAVPTYKDYGEDVDNCPKNTMELKKLDSWEAKLTGKFVAVTPGIAKLLLGAADADSSNAAHIVPRNDITDADFDDLWWVGDYSDVNEDSGTNGTAGYVAIHLMNTLNTGGFVIQSNDKGKGQFDFDFTAHYSLDDQDEVPFEIYVKAGVEGQ